MRILNLDNPTTMDKFSPLVQQTLVEAGRTLDATFFVCVIIKVAAR